MNLALNLMVNRITGFSPLFVMTGRPPRLSRRVVFKTTEDEDVAEKTWEIVEKMEKVFEEVNEKVQDHLQYRQKHYLDDDAKEFQEGKMVLVLYHTRGVIEISRKLKAAWSLPFIIKRRISPTT